ncbi:hypothetical protein BCR42DRAFT_413163 [Absidia repens]|uniref:C2H2-type domain-containing protein n=1 Tax=Absidia repens TaxID=90262 RepID=A0A1X2IKM9_9FUNG|nr:hypothetical protein BCR42DRAFT_413163 [Absidia repens]
MYQENNLMMNGVCTFTIDKNNNNYPPSTWMQGTNRHDPPPPLMMIKQEQHQDLNRTAPDTMNGYYGNMCQPLVMDNPSSLSSPNACGGPLLLPHSPTDVLSQSTSSSPTMDDQWFDLYSPTQSHCTYSMEQRHSFDQSMFIDNNSNTMAHFEEEKRTDYPMYCCNTASNYPLESPMPSPSLSSPSLSYYHPYYTNPVPRSPHSPMAPVARHQSMPSLYHYQQQRPLPSSSSSPASGSPALGLGLGLGLGSESEPIRPYQCHLCTRGFARKHDLQRHIRVHTGDKPYACLSCKKAFARTDALKRHLRMEDHCRNSPEIQNMKNTGKRRYKNL